MLKLGRYQPQKIQSSHLKSAENIDQVEHAINAELIDELN